MNTGHRKHTEPLTCRHTLSCAKCGTPNYTPASITQQAWPNTAMPTRPCTPSHPYNLRNIVVLRMRAVHPVTNSTRAGVAHVCKQCLTHCGLVPRRFHPPTEQQQPGQARYDRTGIAVYSPARRQQFGQAPRALYTGEPPPPAQPTAELSETCMSLERPGIDKGPRISFTIQQQARSPMHVM